MIGDVYACSSSIGQRSSSTTMIKVKCEDCRSEEWSVIQSGRQLWNPLADEFDALRLLAKSRGLHLLNSAKLPYMGSTSTDYIIDFYMLKLGISAFKGLKSKCFIIF